MISHRIVFQLAICCVFGSVEQVVAKASDCRATTQLFVFEDESVGSHSNLGYKDAAGNVVISGRYSLAFDFTEYGYAYANGNYINEKAEVLLTPYLFENGPDDFMEGLARYVENGKVGFVNQCLRPVVPAEFDWAGPFSNGIAVVCRDCSHVFEDEYREHSAIKGGTWGVINSRGKRLVPLKYPDAPSALEAYQKNNSVEGFQ